MNLAVAFDPSPHRTIPEVLTTLTDRARVGEAFLHTRYNDGECNAMFGLRKEEETNCDGHYYYSEMGKELLATFAEVYDRFLHDDRVLLGSYLITDPNHEGAKALAHWLNVNRPLWKLLPWATGDVWCESTKVHDGGELTGLLTTVRQSANARPVVLVSNETVGQARYCLGASYIQVPNRNVWDVRDYIEVDCRPYAERGALFVWCAGFLSRTLSWKIFKEFPDTSHIDLGHLFDGVFDLQSRDWFSEKGYPEDAPGVAQRRWNYYNETFAPYVRSFIP